MREIHAKNSASAAVRAKLDHPVIDADAHILECEWAVQDFIRQIGGPEIATRFEKMGRPGYSKGHRSMFWAAPSDAWEMVEEERITEDDFRLFVFENTAEMHAEMNPDFYKGTAVEAAVGKFMADKRATPATAAE